MLLKDPLKYGTFITGIMKYLDVMMLADVTELDECAGFKAEHVWEDCHSAGFELGDIAFGTCGGVRVVKISKLRQAPKWYIRASSSSTRTQQTPTV